MSLRTDLLPLADDLRSLLGPSEFDVQTVKLTIVERLWSGGKRGMSPMVETVLSDIPSRYKIRSVTAAEIAGSGGVYELEDQKVGGITPGLVWDVTAATNATPIVVTTEQEHGLFTGDSVTARGFLGLTAANGVRVITKVSDTSFSLDGTVGNGAYAGGGKIQVTGFTPEQLKPKGSIGAEIVYKLTGAVTGDYKLLALHTEKAFSYFLVLRRMRTTP